MPLFLRIIKLLKEIILNTNCIYHLAFGCNLSFLNQNLNELLNDICNKHGNKIQSLHMTTIKSQFSTNVKLNYYANKYNNNNNYYQQRTNQTNRHSFEVNSQLVESTLLKFTNLHVLSINYEHLTSDLLKDLCDKQLKK